MISIMSFGWGLMGNRSQFFYVMIIYGILVLFDLAHVYAVVRDDIDEIGQVAGCSSQREALIFGF